MATTTEHRSSLLNVIQQPQVQSLLDEAREQIEREEGVSFRTINIDKQFRKPYEHNFTADQRPHTTLLFGGLTFRHEHLLEGSLKSLGYTVAPVPTPNTDSFQLGKEYGNNGQCNPTYFTVGNLVQYLQYLRDEKGYSTQYIIDHYIFLTAGACGPCRFGMYEAEYRLALRNAGFDGFRVMLFQQKGGLEQGDLEAGLKMDLDFFLGMINAFNMGDVINEVTNQIRPYEKQVGQTDRVMNEGLKFMHEVMATHKVARFDGSLGDLLESKTPKLHGTFSKLTKFVDQLVGDEYMAPLRTFRDRLDDVEVDRLQPKPIVKITGEFWAHTTEGDGNFNMFRFLQTEGAEIIVEPLATWLTYMMWQTKIKSRDRKGLLEGEEEPKWYEFKRLAKRETERLKKLAIINVADYIFRREYKKIVDNLGGTASPIVDMFELERLGHEFYHTRQEGGEGHLEVAKNIYYSTKNLCHMVLSLKPFGCMPSTQSDGTQSAVINRFRDMIFLPIETSGEGEINAHSRVQMALGEAKAKAKREFAEVLDSIPYSLEELRAYVAEHRELRRPFYKFPRDTKGVAGTAAHFAIHLAKRMQAEGVQPKRGVAAAAQ